MNNDSISRQAAIEIVDRYNKSHMILKGKPMLGAASIVIELEALPSAQPEIVRCGQCKYAEVADAQDNQDGYTCQFHRGSIWFSESYCSWGERKSDEQV